MCGREEFGGTREGTNSFVLKGWGTNLWGKQDRGETGLYYGETYRENKIGDTQLSMAKRRGS
jgi:hypothetical protein